MEDIMSGRKINDHSFWAGAKSKGSVFPEGVHLKMESSAGGAGELGKYEDTTEAIRAKQEAGESKIKARPVKPGYTN